MDIAQDINTDNIVQTKQHIEMNEQQANNNKSQSNCIDDLVALQNIEDNFQICAQDQVYIGQASTNLQLKQAFNVLRYSIQKLFNQQELSISVVKLLPTQLEDDFNDFVSYIKQKIVQIKNQNNLTFIAAEVGKQPSLQDISLELKEFIEKQTADFLNLKQIISSQQILITSLMNQKTQQENTITQQQLIQQQFQKLHLQQYETLKRQIKQQRESIDQQTAYYQSLINIFKKNMKLWIEDEDNYEDFEDNLKLMATIYKFNAKEHTLIGKYLQKFKQLKNIQ